MAPASARARKSRSSTSAARRSTSSWQLSSTRRDSVGPGAVRSATSISPFKIESGVRSSCAASALKWRTEVNERSRRASISFSTAARRPSSSSRFSVARRRERSSAPMRRAAATIASTGAERPSRQDPACGRHRGERQRKEPDHDEQEARACGLNSGERHRHLHQMGDTPVLHDGVGEQADRARPRPRAPSVFRRYLAPARRCSARRD